MSTAASPRLARAVLAAGISLSCTFVLVYAPALLSWLKTPQQFLAVRALSVLVVLLLARAVLAPLARAAPAELGLAVEGRTMVSAFRGLLAGCLALTAAFCVAWGAGGLVVVPGAAATSASLLAFELATFVVSALFEELCFRVGLVGVLRTVLPAPLSVGLSAAVFGLLHATNPGASTLAVANTALAGVLLALLFLDRDGRPRVPSLGLCTGFHVGWNVMQSLVLGIPVSGFAGHSRIVAVEAADVTWSGGSYGLEAGWGATLVLLVACVWAVRRADLRSVAA